MSGPSGASSPGGTGGVLLTGGYGFLGWHTAVRLHALHAEHAQDALHAQNGGAPRRLTREEFADEETLAAAVAGADAVLHLAGVNRPTTEAPDAKAGEDEVEQGNIALAHTLAAALRRAGRPVPVVYANSVHADPGRPDSGRRDLGQAHPAPSATGYARGKAAAASVLRTAAVETGGRFADVVLPNLFGEHGRPAYNSFVATFAHEVAAGRTPTVTGDREIDLLHVQDAAAALLAAIGYDGVRRINGEPHRIGDVLTRLQRMHALYAGRGEIPPLTGAFEVNLFNTYRAAAFEQGAEDPNWPVRPEVIADERGGLFEAVRSHGGTGQVFVSTTAPGAVRGEHYHLHKVERFCVLRGTAEISLRRLLHDDVVTFRVGGDGRPAFLDMPTLWAHNLRNAGDDDLITLFWTDQLLDREHPDQFPERVTPERTPDRA